MAAKLSEIIEEVRVRRDAALCQVQSIVRRGSSKRVTVNVPFLPVSKYSASPVAEPGTNFNSRQMSATSSLALVVESTTKSCSCPLEKCTYCRTLTRLMFALHSMMCGPRTRSPCLETHSVCERFVFVGGLLLNLLDAIVAFQCRWIRARA